MRSLVISPLVLILLLWSGPASQAFAQSPSPSVDVEKLEVKGVVMAKFICGTSTSGELAPGRYFTAINLANANGGGAPPIILFMDLIQTNGSRRVVEHIGLEALPGLSGLEIDCADIASRFEADLNGELLKGFVRLVRDRSTSAPLTSLEGVVVYTAAPAAKQ